MNGRLDGLIGRRRELERIIQILARRNRNNVVLVGEPGVGKTAVVEGLAERIAAATAPEALASRRVLMLHAGALVVRRRPQTEEQWLTSLALFRQENAIVCIKGLLDLAASSAWPVLETLHALERHVLRGDFQLVLTGTSNGLSRAQEKTEILARHFEVVELVPPTEDEAIQVLAGVKNAYEKHHGVVFGEGTIEAAVYLSARFLRHRQLPDRALDLLDEAGARVQLLRKCEPAEVREACKRIRELSWEMQRAIGRHDFKQGGRLADQERQERERLQQLHATVAPEEPANNVGVQDIVAAVADRVGVPVAAVNAVLELKDAGRFARVYGELATVVGGGARAWIPFLAAYLTQCSAEVRERLAEAIRREVATFHDKTRMTSTVSGASTNFR